MFSERGKSGLTLGEFLIAQDAPADMDYLVFRLCQAPARCVSEDLVIHAHRLSHHYARIGAPGLSSTRPKILAGA